MNKNAYPYVRENDFRYLFISEGKKGMILKTVEFTPAEGNGVFNLAFGDLLDDDRLDDKVNTNNHDIPYVLATVIDVIKDFTNRHPRTKIAFIGSTPMRTMLYTRVLKRYYATFNKMFTVTAIVLRQGEYMEIAFASAENENICTFS